MEPISEILPYRATLHQTHGNTDIFTDGEAPLSSEHGGIVVAAEPRQILSSAQMAKCVRQMAQAIHKDIGNDQQLLFMGIRSRGVPLAQWVAKEFGKLADAKVQVGSLDINLYRDDLSEVDHQPVVRATELPVPLQGRGVVLVDDVLFTGRTIRAALDALMDFGRPRFVRLAVLIDRGFRELPIQPDYVGRTVKTTLQENVKVMLEATDGTNEVVVTHQR